MANPIPGELQWPESLEEKYAYRAKLIDSLRVVTAEISELETHILISGKEVAGASYRDETQAIKFVRPRLDGEGVGISAVGQRDGRQTS